MLERSFGEGFGSKGFGETCESMNMFFSFGSMASGSGCWTLGLWEANQPKIHITRGKISFGAVSRFTLLISIGLQVAQCVFFLRTILFGGDLGFNVAEARVA